MHYVLCAAAACSDEGNPPSNGGGSWLTTTVGEICVLEITTLYLLPRCHNTCYRARYRSSQAPSRAIDRMLPRDEARRGVFVDPVSGDTLRIVHSNADGTHRSWCVDASLPRSPPRPSESLARFDDRDESSRALYSRYDTTLDSAARRRRSPSPPKRRRSMSEECRYPARDDRHAKSETEHVSKLLCPPRVFTAEILNELEERTWTSIKISTKPYPDDARHVMEIRGTFANVRYALG